MLLNGVLWALGGGNGIGMVFIDIDGKLLPGALITKNIFHVIECSYPWPSITSLCKL